MKSQRRSASPSSSRNDYVFVIQPDQADPLASLATITLNAEGAVSESPASETLRGLLDRKICSLQTNRRPPDRRGGLRYQCPIEPIRTAYWRSRSPWRCPW